MILQLYNVIHHISDDIIIGEKLFQREEEGIAINMIVLRVHLDWLFELM